MATNRTVFIPNKNIENNQSLGQTVNKAMREYIEPELKRLEQREFIYTAGQQNKKMSTKNKLKEFKPRKEFEEYINCYWFFINDTGEMINWPVVPDGCSDIIFYLDGSQKLDGLTA